MANQYFTCVLEAWVDHTTIHARMHYYRSGSFTYLDSIFPNPTMTIAGETFTDSGFGDRVRNGIDVGDVYTTEFTKTVYQNGTYGVAFSAGAGVRSDFEGYWSTSVTVTEAVTAPTGLTVSNLQRGTRSFSADVSVTGWGGAGSGNSRYRELQVWTLGMTEPRKYQPAYGDSLSSRIVVNDTSSGGTLVIIPNTMYTIGSYATNGSISTGSVRYGDFATLPEAAEVAFLSTDGETATFSYTTKADGGQYPKRIEYSLDAGNTWLVGTTVTGGAIQTGEFTVTGLTPGTEYTMLTRTRTDAGATLGNSVVFIAATIQGYGSVGETTKKITRAYGSVNGTTKRIVAGYWSVNGVSKKLF